MMTSSRFLTTILLAACLVVGTFLAEEAAAQIPEDFFSTSAGPEVGGSGMQFGTPGLPPLPADFFGPGSDPFDGRIDLAQAIAIANKESADK